MAAQRQKTSNGANLGFEAQLWATADKLRGNMEPSDYKHVALGLIFLKYISDVFEAKRAELLDEDLADPEDPEEFLAENVFWVPNEARWSHLQAKAKQTTIGKDIDDAMLAIENHNPSLKGVRCKDYARPTSNKFTLGEPMDLVSGSDMLEEVGRSSDILERVYQYFLDASLRQTASAVASSIRPALLSGCRSRCWSPTQGASTILAVARAVRST
jgi:type I restriction enzyme M protein